MAPTPVDLSSAPSGDASRRGGDPESRVRRDNFALSWNGAHVPAPRAWKRERKLAIRHPSSNIHPMKRKAGFILLNTAATLVMLGGCFDMFLPAVPANLVQHLNLPDQTVTPEISSLLLALFRALGGCLLAIG